MENKSEEKERGNSKKEILVIFILLLFIIIVSGAIFLNYKMNNKDEKNQDTEINNAIDYSTIHLLDNSLNDFDISFLQINNDTKNKLYSPLSIKYALAMLEEGANGVSREQISNVLGEYNSKKYVNSSNMSFANAMFIKDSYKEFVKNSYVNTLLEKYNASVIYDSFDNPDVINSWVSDRTFNLVNNLVDDVDQLDFILTNALAIDMEWKNVIQSEEDNFTVEYEHRDYYKIVEALVLGYYNQLKFENVPYSVMSAEIGAVANRYDIINDIGEDNIRATVGADYQKWLDAGGCGDVSEEPDVETYLNTYINEIGEGYNEVTSSTDFEFYVDYSVKVFAKDLKEYDGTTLQYVGIMPINKRLDVYLKDAKASDINTLINNLKPLEIDSFKDGVITEIYGYIPMFKFEYELDLINNLKRFGITDVFDESKADLSNLTSSKAVISKATHKANIEFSNVGIKAAAATAVGAAGATGCWYDYIYDVPVEKIDLTFDKPYLFLIRDKESGEVWFTGTVYQPLEWYEPYEDYR